MSVAALQGSGNRISCLSRCPCDTFLCDLVVFLGTGTSGDMALVPTGLRVLSGLAQVALPGRKVQLRREEWNRATCFHYAPLHPHTLPE